MCVVVAICCPAVGWRRGFPPTSDEWGGEAGDLLVWTMSRPRREAPRTGSFASETASTGRPAGWRWPGDTVPGQKHARAAPRGRACWRTAGPPGDAQDSTGVSSLGGDEEREGRGGDSRPSLLVVGSRALPRDQVLQWGLSLWEACSGSPALQLAPGLRFNLKMD